MTGRNRRNFSPWFRLEAAQLVLFPFNVECKTSHQLAWSHFRVIKTLEQIIERKGMVYLPMN